MAAAKLQALWNHPAGPKTSELILSNPFVFMFCICYFLTLPIFIAPCDDVDIYIYISVTGFGLGYEFWFSDLIKGHVQGFIYNLCFFFFEKKNLIWPWIASWEKGFSGVKDYETDG